MTQGQGQPEQSDEAARTAPTKPSTLERWTAQSGELRITVGFAILVAAASALIVTQPRHLDWWFFDVHANGPAPALLGRVITAIALALVAAGCLRLALREAETSPVVRAAAAVAALGAIALAAVTGDVATAVRLVTYAALAVLLALRAYAARANTTFIAALGVLVLVVLLAAGTVSATAGDLVPIMGLDGRWSVDPWDLPPRPWLYASFHAAIPLALGVGFAALWRRQSFSAASSGVLPASSASLTERGLDQAAFAIALKLVLGGLTGLAWVFWSVDSPTLLNLSALLAVLALPLSALLVSGVTALLRAELAADRVSLRVAQGLLVLGLLAELLFVACVFLSSKHPMRTNVAFPEELLVVGVWILMPAISVIGWLALAAFMVWARRLAQELGRVDIAKATVRAMVWLAIGVAGTGVLLAARGTHSSSPFHATIDPGGPLPPSPMVWLGVGLGLITIWGMISVTVVIAVLRDHVRAGIAADRVAERF